MRQYAENTPNGEKFELKKQAVTRMTYAAICSIMQQSIQHGSRTNQLRKNHVSSHKMKFQNYRSSQMKKVVVLVTCCQEKLSELLYSANKQKKTTAFLPFPRHCRKQCKQMIETQTNLNTLRTCSRRVSL